MKKKKTTNDDLEKKMEDNHQIFKRIIIGIINIGIEE
jgi:hypothetical protein